MTEAYWKIGEKIVLEEQNGKKRAAYGESILKYLSIASTQEFGKGFSYANLRNFRQFYLTYPDPEICYALRSKLTWTHHCLIMRVENMDARNYYLSECEHQNWSSILNKNARKSQIKAYLLVNNALSETNRLIDDEIYKIEIE